jgi:hypothetical protein
MNKTENSIYAFGDESAGIKQKNDRNVHIAVCE